MTTDQHAPKYETEPHPATHPAPDVTGKQYPPRPQFPTHVPYYIPITPPASPHEPRFSVDEEVALRVRVAILEKELENLARQKAEADVAVSYLIRQLSNTFLAKRVEPEAEDAATLSDRLCRLERDNDTLREQILRMNSLFIDLASKTVEDSKIKADEMGNFNSRATTLVNQHEKRMPGEFFEEGEVNNEQSDRATGTGPDSKHPEKAVGQREEEKEDEDREHAEYYVPSSYESEYHPSLAGSFQTDTNIHQHVARFIKPQQEIVNDGDSPRAGSSTPPSSTSSPTPPTSQDSSFSTSPIIPNPPAEPKADRLRGNFGGHERFTYKGKGKRGRGRANYSDYENASPYPPGMDVIVPEPYFNNSGPTDTDQLQYVPVNNENAYRTVMINNLPSNTKIEQIFPIIRGGVIVEATLLDTSASYKKETKSAMVWFLHSAAAEAFVNWAKKTWLHFNDVALDVILIKNRPTWPLTRNMRHNIEVVGCRRAFTVYGVPADIDPSRFRADIHINKYSKQSNIEAVRPIRDADKKLIGVHVRFTAIKYAINAAAMFHGGYGGGYYRECRVEWGGDPCEGPLNEDAGIFGNVYGIEAKMEDKQKGAQEDAGSGGTGTGPLSAEAAEAKSDVKIVSKDEVQAHGFCEADLHEQEIEASMSRDKVEDKTTAAHAGKETSRASSEITTNGNDIDAIVEHDVNALGITLDVELESARSFDCPNDEQTPFRDGAAEGQSKAADDQTKNKNDSGEGMHAPADTIGAGTDGEGAGASTSTADTDVDNHTASEHVEVEEAMEHVRHAEELLDCQLADEVQAEE